MIDNVNLLKLINTVDQNDENGIKYVKLIESAIIDNRACIRKYSTSKIKENKEKFFKNINKPYIYCEVHHIIPKCCGGTDEADNLVYLYCTEKYPEHIKAHEYLWKTTSIFSEFHSQLTASFFKMTHSRKLSSTLTIQEAARLREEYGNWKHETLSKKYGKNKRAKKILYNGIVYPSARQLEKVKMYDDKYHSKGTILSWARENKHNLSLYKK